MQRSAWLGFSRDPHNFLKASHASQCLADSVLIHASHPGFDRPRLNFIGVSASKHQLSNALRNNKNLDNAGATLIPGVVALWAALRSAQIYRIRISIPP